jgi:hypothetical protein
MSHIAEGCMARESSRPEVWVVKDGERHWVPDGQTVDSLGGWGAVQVVDDRIDNPIGDNYPSVIDHAKHYPDGNLLTAAPQPNIYVMEDGKRRWITDPATFDAHGFRWEDVRHLSEVEINAIPLGAPLSGGGPALPNLVAFDTGSTFLGAGHYMSTKGALARQTGRCAGSTRTRSVTWFGGFHGAVYVILTDANDVPVKGGQSGQHRYGVDGTMIGQSDRTDSWEFDVSTTEAERVRYAHTYHTWAPDDFATVIGKWQTAGKSVAELATTVGGIAKVVTAILA